MTLGFDRHTWDALAMRERLGQTRLAIEAALAPSTVFGIDGKRQTVPHNSEIVAMQERAFGIESMKAVDPHLWLLVFERMYVHGPVARTCKAFAAITHDAHFRWRAFPTHPLYQRGWLDLTTQQRIAAEAIGYGSVSWSDAKDWAELSDAEKAAAARLGHTQMTWDTNASVPLDRFDWAHLSGEQQQAAAVLGYDRSYWDAD